MGRSPKAREIVLDAAERLVKAHGAASLTFERLADESGVTRGGITYHFPTKSDLLRALVERDLEQWRELSDSLRPKIPGLAPEIAEILGRIRSCGAKDPEHQRLVAGLVAAAAHEPDLLVPVRALHAERYADRTWTDRELRLLLPELAADGLFWLELFDLYRLPDEARGRLLELMETLVRDWAEGPAAPPKRD